MFLDCLSLLYDPLHQLLWVSVPVAWADVPWLSLPAVWSSSSAAMSICVPVAWADVPWLSPPAVWSSSSAPQCRCRSGTEFWPGPWRTDSALLENNGQSPAGQYTVGKNWPGHWNTVRTLLLGSRRKSSPPIENIFHWKNYSLILKQFLLKSQFKYSRLEVPVTKNPWICNE